MTVDFAIRGGQIVTGSGPVVGDLIIRDGKVEGVVASDLHVEAVEELDATGKYVLPGLVDPHCHFNTFSHHVDDLESLSAAALAGGVTTIIPFLIPGGGEGQPESLAEVLDHFVGEGRRRSVVDFGFHVALWPRGAAVDEIDLCVERGCTSFKMFMALPRLGRMVPDDLLVQMMQRMAEKGALAMTHSENGLVTDYLEAKMIAEGRTKPSDLGASRPPELEEEATSRATCLARVAGADLYVVHVTCAGAIEAIARARSRGWRVIGETCPQYLTLTEEAMVEHGALAKVAPPLRTSEDQDALWDALRDDRLSSLGSDHSAHLRSVKERGNSNVFEGTPFGAATVETMLPVLFSEGIAGGRLSIERLVSLTSANPARIFGLYPRKGSLLPGADADVVLLDPAREHSVQGARHKDKSGYSLYEGWRLKGAITHVLRGGHVVVREGEPNSDLPRGDYLERAAGALPEELL
jgi:dihydropyrimidinase